MNKCINWKGQKTPGGYGARYFNGKTMNAHRAAYIEAFGLVPKGIDIDHICENRLCVNLDHLQPLTHRENSLKSKTSPSAINSKKTHCPKGHPFAGENLQIRPTGSRQCRECHNAWNTKYRNQRSLTR